MSKEQIMSKYEAFVTESLTGISRGGHLIEDDTYRNALESFTQEAAETGIATAPTQDAYISGYNAGRISAFVKLRIG